MNLFKSYLNLASFNENWLLENIALNALVIYEKNVVLPNII